MNVVLWIVAVALAALFFLAGFTKATQDKDGLQTNLAWVEDFSSGTVRFIGIVEMLGAVGLILPAATGVAVIFTPLAATGLALVMVLAAAVHVRRHETQLIVVNVVLLAPLVLVAVMRFGPQPF